MKHLTCLTPFFALLLLFFPTQNVRAQISVYGSVALTNFVFFTNGYDYPKSDTGGVIGGAFYNFPIQSRLTAGIDARVNYGFGQRGGTAAAVALRIGFVPRHVVLRPYFEIGGGVVSSTEIVNSSILLGLGPQSKRYTSGGVELAAGLDIRLNNSFDLRAFEFGAVAPPSNSNNTTVGSGFIDAGVVYHFQKH